MGFIAQRLVLRSILRQDFINSNSILQSEFKKLQGIFQSISHRQPDKKRLLTQLACDRLPGFQPLSLQGITDKGCPTKKISSFAEQIASPCDPPHPPGDNCRAFPLVPAGSQAPKLSTTTLHDGAPPHFWSIAGRTPFSKIQTYMYFKEILNKAMGIFFHVLSFFFVRLGFFL